MEILHVSASPHVLGTSPQVLHQIAIITINLYHPPKNGRAAFQGRSKYLDTKVGDSEATTSFQFCFWGNFLTGSTILQVSAVNHIFISQTTCHVAGNLFSCLAPLCVYSSMKIQNRNEFLSGSDFFGVSYFKLPFFY